MKKLIFIVLAFSCLAAAQAQIKWINPQTANAKIYGQALPNEPRSNYYQRLPDCIKAQVRKPVWDLSLNTAGEQLHFYTNSPRIVVRYTLAEGHSMTHMPATGKSGVDLYAYDHNGVEKWCAAYQNFSDTVSVNYNNLIYQRAMHSLGFEYHLILPPYNTVKWLEIGVDSSAFFSFIEPSPELPILVYGTSIAQGACASRPGMIWTNIVARQMQTPVINLGFSGNGRLEKGILDVIKTTPSKVVILDCMPNLADDPQDTITKLVINAVEAIRSAQSDVKILLVDHLGYSHGTMIDKWQAKVDNSIKGQRAGYDALLARGFKDVYYLSYDEIAMPQDATVEAIHPSDYGMQVYANAYTKKLREILHQPIGSIASQIPIAQRREPDNYEWRERHQALLAQVKEKAPKVVIFGNSITHFWGGVDGFHLQAGRDSWDKKVAPLGAINMGMGYDLIENVLWRVYHGALDGYKADKIVISIGVNNILTGHKDQVIEGVRFLVDAIKFRQPQAKIIITGVYPARTIGNSFAEVNAGLAVVARECGVEFNDYSALFLGKDGLLDESLFRDGLHPNAKGYRLIVDRFISPLR